VDADSQGGCLTCLCTLDDPAMAGQATEGREGFACLVAFISKGYCTGYCSRRRHVDGTIYALKVMRVLFVTARALRFVCGKLM
jgi:hypothetical protein